MSSPCSLCVCICGILNNRDSRGACVAGFRRPVRWRGGMLRLHYYSNHASLRLATIHEDDEDVYRVDQIKEFEEVPTSYKEWLIDILDRGTRPELLSSGSRVIMLFRNNQLEMQHKRLRKLCTSTELLQLFEININSNS